MAYIGVEPIVPNNNREVDDISSSFNGSTTSFTLQVSSVNVSPDSDNNVLVSLGGVIQNPGNDYTITASTINFTTAPASGLSFFGLILGESLQTGTVGDSVITNVKVSDTAAIAGSKITPNFASVGAATTRFMVIPKVTTSERGNLSGLVSGAFIYNTSVNKLQVYNGSSWETVTSS